MQRSSDDEKYEYSPRIGRVPPLRIPSPRSRWAGLGGRRVSPSPPRANGVRRLAAEVRSTGGADWRRSRSREPDSDEDAPPPRLRPLRAGRSVFRARSDSESPVRNFQRGRFPTVDDVRSASVDEPAERAPRRRPLPPVYQPRSRSREPPAPAHGLGSNVRDLHDRMLSQVRKESELVYEEMADRIEVAQEKQRRLIDRTIERKAKIVEFCEVLRAYSLWKALWSATREERLERLARDLDAETRGTRRQLDELRDGTRRQMDELRWYAERSAARKWLGALQLAGTHANRIHVDWAFRSWYRNMRLNREMLLSSQRGRAGRYLLNSMRLAGVHADNYHLARAMRSWARESSSSRLEQVAQRYQQETLTARELRHRQLNAILARNRRVTLATAALQAWLLLMYQARSLDDRSRLAYSCLRARESAVESMYRCHGHRTRCTVWSAWRGTCSRGHAEQRRRLEAFLHRSYTASKRALNSLLGREANSLLTASFAAWVQLTRTSLQGRLHYSERELLSARRRREAQAVGKTLLAWMDDHDRNRQKFFLQSWQTTVNLIKSQTSHTSSDRQVRRARRVVGRTLLVWGMESDLVRAQVALAHWRESAKMSKAHWYNEMMGRRIVRFHRLIDKAERVWGNDQARRRAHVYLSAWRRVVMTTGTVVVMQEKLERIERKSNRTLEKAMHQWGAQQAGERVLLCFRAWKEGCQKEKEEEKVAVVEQKLAKLDRKEEARLQKTMWMWEAQQTEGLLNIVFNVWKEDKQKAKETESMYMIERKMEEMAAKGETTLQKTMMKWGMQQTEQLVGIIFATWREDYLAEKIDKKVHMMTAQNEAAFQKIMMKWAGDQTGVLIQEAFRAWRDELSSRKEKEAEEAFAERMAKMDSDKEAGLQKLMMKFAGDQKSVLYQRVFAAFKENLAMAAEDKAERELKAHFSAADEARLKKLAMKFGADQIKVLFKGIFHSWRDETRKNKSVRKQRGAYVRDVGVMMSMAIWWSKDNVRSALFSSWVRVVQTHREQDACTAADIRQSKADVVLNKTLIKWAGEQEVALEGVIFELWKEAHMKSKMDAKMQVLNAKGDLTLQKAMMKWGSQQSGQLLGVTYTCWKELLQKRKEEKAVEAVEEKMRALAAKGDSTLQHAMHKWGAQQSGQLVQLSFQAWKEDLAKIKEEAALLEMERRMDAMNSAGESVLQKTMMKWASDQTGVLLKEVFTIWKEDFIAEKMEKNLSKMNAQSEAAMQKMMMKFAGDQEGVLVSGAFAGWKEALRMRKEEEQAEQMRQQMEHMDAAKEAQMQKLMLQFAGGNTHMLIQRCFAAWKEWHIMLADEAAEEEMRHRMLSADAAKEAQMQKLMMKFAGDQVGVLVGGAFHAWKEDTREIVAEKRFQREMEKQTAAHNEAKKDAGMKAMMKMIGGGEHLLKNGVFKGWVDYVKESRVERAQRSKQDEFLSQLAGRGELAQKKKEQMERMIAQMFGRNLDQLVAQVLDAWQQHTSKHRIKREDNNTAAWLLDVQQHYVDIDQDRYRLMAIVAHWRSACRDRAHLHALEQMERAMEQERQLLKQRCEEWAARTQQAEQDATQALAETAKSNRELEILRAKLDEEGVARTKQERELAELRDQVQSQAVRCRTLQRQQAAMAVLQVGNVEERENLDRQLTTLADDRERLLDAKAALLKETGERKLVEWQLEEVLRQGANTVMESDRPPSPLQRRPVASPSSAGQRWR